MARSKAARADRDARIYALAVAGRTERQIAAEVRLSPARVHAIVAEEIGRRIGPPAEAYVARREAELHDLWSKAYDVLGNQGADVDTKLKALATALKVNESRRRLRGADAPDSLRVQLDHRVDEESAVVVEAIMAGLKAVSLSPDRERYALEAAGARLKAIEEDVPYDEPEPLPPETSGPAVCAPYTEGGSMFIDGPDGLRYRVMAVERQPSPTVAQLALPPGPSAAKAQHRDGVDAVMDAVREFEAEFGSVFDDDDEDGTDGTETDGA
jgi:hypothetical protein